MSMFDWENLAKNIQEDALEDKKTSGYEEDSRFYKLSRDKNNNGGALIRFIPSADGVPFIRMIRINADKGANNRFCKDWSPQSIGQDDPFNEKFLELWREGKKEEAKKFGRQERYIANIKVLKDPANPENEGKIFLLDMSKTLFAKIKAALKPSEDEMAIDPDLKPKKVFNPLKGNSFLLKIKEGENKFLTFADSKFAEKEDAIYDSEAEAEKDIKENAYTLKEWMEEDFYKSYDELKDCLNWFMGIEKEASKSNEGTKTPETPETPETDEIDTGLSLSEEAPKEAPAPKKEPEPEPSPKADDLDDLDAELDDLLS